MTEAERVRRHRSAIITLSLYRAKKAIERQLQAQGQKLAHYSCRELRLMAEDYFDLHRDELIADAAHVIATSPHFARWRVSGRKGERNRTLAEPQAAQRAGS